MPYVRKVYIGMRMDFSEVIFKNIFINKHKQMNKRIRHSGLRKIIYSQTVQILDQTIRIHMARVNTEDTPPTFKG